ncbi:MAG: NrpR regulatory domain-containing protein [bacterium]
MERKLKAILKLVSESSAPVGSAELAKKLKAMGIDLSERTVRYHLKNMGEEGLLKVFWKEGRMITSKGQAELDDSLVSEKVGLMSSRIANMAYKMDFDLYKKGGSVILNVSLFIKKDFAKALEIMAPVFKKKLTTGELVAVAKAGEKLGEFLVPDDKIAFGTLCIVNLNGILLKHAIPVESIFGGVLQMENGKPLRFTDMINYSGSTLDPHLVFMRSKMTNVQQACNGAGKILAGLREIPAVSANEAEAIIRKIESAGIGHALMIGKTGQAILGMPVKMDRVGIVVPGGLNPIAAVEEAGIETQTSALGALVSYERLQKFSTI